MTTTAPDGVSIRPAERADLLSVIRIEQTAFPQPWPYQAFEGFLGEPGFLVAEAVDRGGEDVVGGGGDDQTDGERPGLAAAGLDATGIDDDDLCGYVVADVVSDFGRTVGHVKDIAVHPDWRGRGVGSTLLSRALAVLEAGGARRAKLEVRVGNEAAQALYRSFGFSANHVVPGYYDDGEDALLFVADLTERSRE